MSVQTANAVKSMKYDLVPENIKNQIFSGLKIRIRSLNLLSESSQSESEVELQSFCSIKLKIRQKFNLLDEIDL